MPRITALRGADLLLIPANWPPSGLDPVELWRARAIENGFFVAGCNRTGIDLKMDCRPGNPASIPPGGQLLREKSETSRIFEVKRP
jgi:predicted amidohydrolase